MRPLLLAGTILLAAAAVEPAAADGLRPYLRATLGLGWTGDTTWRDADCHAIDPYALFGCARGNDGKPIGARGDFGASPLLGLGAGVEVTPWLRLEADLETQPNLTFDGNANFINAGRNQPVSGHVSQADAMAFAYVEPLAAFGLETKLRPFLGIGAGISRNEIGPMTYEFPELRQPRYSLMPGGTRYDFAWSAAAGLAYPVSERITLELAWRYSDLGEIGTDTGTLFIQRHASSLSLPIAETDAELTSQSVTVSARFGF